MTLERYELSCSVDAYRDGWTIRDFLVHRFRYYAAEIWVERLASGAVRVNGVVVGAEHRVRRGDRVEYELYHAEPEVDFTFAILHEDEHLLAVAKSGNLPVHAGGHYVRHTLIAKLRETYGGELRLAHRLDRETSGVVLLAKTRAVAAALEREFHARRVRKQYVAILRGIAPEAADVDAPIARLDPEGRSAVRVVDRERGKAARTIFRRLALCTVVDRREDRSLVQASPESGRTNQIRVHARHLGHPVLGDKIYGSADAPGAEAGSSAAGPARHLLHCASLTLRHPASRVPITIVAPVPSDFPESWGGPLPPFSVSSPELDFDP